MTSKFSFVESFFVVRYMTEIICTEVTEALQKTEIALQLTLMNTAHSVTWWHVQVCQRQTHPGILDGGGFQIQLRTEGRENGDLGAVAP
jgi:hypothetical protein